MVVADRSTASIPWENYAADRRRNARDDLAVFYSPLKYVVGRLGTGLPSHVERGDLASFGMSGLIQAVEKGDPFRGIEFETFAVHRIWGSILDELRAIDWVSCEVGSQATKWNWRILYSRPGWIGCRATQKWPLKSVSAKAGCRRSFRKLVTLLL